MTLPASGRIAVYTEPNTPFQVQDFPIRAPRADEALVKVSMSTICRSDIHSYQGHRPSPCPGLLGHEIVGNIVALGEGITHDMRGDRLSVGDRITWSEFFIPGDNYFSEVLDLPQKSHGVEKYGHMAATTAPHHHGGFAEYCYVLPKSWILRLPDNITDAEATPINCGVATMVADAPKQGGRIVAGGKIENVYRLQIMNAAEKTMQYHLSVEGLRGLELATDRDVQIKSTESKWVSVRVQLPYEAAVPGSHPIEFDVQASDEQGQSVSQLKEKSVFLVPR